MKLKILLLLLITFQSYSQISVGPTHMGKARKFNKGTLEKFKNTETIFVLSNIYEKEVYEKILKESWDVTPYKIVDLENFKLEDYLSNKYSIAHLTGFKRITQQISHDINTRQIKYGVTGTYQFIYFDIIMYDSNAIFKELKKLSPKRRKKKKERIIDIYTYNIARFYLYSKADFIRNSFSEDMDEIIKSIYTNDVFFNYKPGFLKNYFQKINNLLKNEETYWMHGKDYLPELKNLTNYKLYIPSSMSIKYNAWKGKDSEENNENIYEIFKKYDYQYEIISDDELSDKIMNNEECYYLRYVRVNSEKFLQVVNSKNGEIIYRNYIPGLSYNIKPKHIKKLNSKIKKASKK
jgi:hypothetical protein